MGGLDDRSPYFFMLNNAKLKETLSQKVTAKTTEVIQVPAISIVEPSGNAFPLPSLSIVLTFSLSLDEAPSQMKRIQEMISDLRLQPNVQPPTAPVVTSMPPEAKPAPVQPIPPVSSQVPAKPVASAARMTDKQKRMIFALIARKNLSPESVSEILESEFGHGDGARLSKPEASRLIDKLMAK